MRTLISACDVLFKSDASIQTVRLPAQSPRPKPRDNSIRYRFRSDHPSIVRISPRPHARLAALDGERSAHRQTVLDVEACAAELLHPRRVQHHIAKSRWGEKACAGVDQRDADDPKTPVNSDDFTPRAAPNSVHVPQSKNSKKRLVKTMPAASQCAHSTVNSRRLTKLVMASSQTALVPAYVFITISQLFLLRCLTNRRRAHAIRIQNGRD
jgi:hypothetical protein